MRNVSEKVFSNISGMVDEQSIKLLMDVLESSEDKEMTEAAEEDEEEEDAVPEKMANAEETNENDVEMDQVSDASDSDSSDDSALSDEEQDYDSTKEMDVELFKKAAQILGVRGHLKEMYPDMAIVSDDEDDENVELGDDEMEKFDEKLAANL